MAAPLAAVPWLIGAGKGLLGLGAKVEQQSLPGQLQEQEPDVLLVPSLVA